MAEFIFYRQLKLKKTHPHTGGINKHIKTDTARDGSFEVYSASLRTLDLRQFGLGHLRQIQLDDAIGRIDSMGH